MSCQPYDAGILLSHEEFFLFVWVPGAEHTAEAQSGRAALLWKAPAENNKCGVHACRHWSSSTIRTCEGRRGFNFAEDAYCTQSMGARCGHV